ncbi:MAG: elongation factor P [candidate division WOR-3 bacterium]
MIPAAELRSGMCIRIQDELYRILEAEFKVGTAKLPSSVHLRLKNLRTGTQTEQRLHPETKVEDIALQNMTLTYSYTDGDSLVFMNPKDFDQVSVLRRMIGPFEPFLESGCMLKIDFFGDEPIDIQIPKLVEVVVASTGPALHGDMDSAPKTATLENGLEILVPQFIKTGDRIRLDVTARKYIERVR